MPTDALSTAPRIIVIKVDDIIVSMATEAGPLAHVSYQKSPFLKRASVKYTPAARARNEKKRPKCFIWDVFKPAALFSPFLLHIRRILPEHTPSGE